MSKAPAGGVESPTDGWLELLAEMVAIDSGPGDDDGIRRVQQLTALRLQTLGFHTDAVPTAGPPVLKATREGQPGSPSVLLVGHADTVFPPGTASHWPFTVTGDRASGPGVADMKGGLVTALAALTHCAEILDRLHLTVLVNGDEESGSVASRPLIEAESPNHQVAMVYEPARPSGQFVVSRSGVQRYRVEVTGRPAHTGVEPEKGANAVETAAHHILRLQQLGRELADGSITVAQIGGGTRPNVVPATAWLLVDARLGDMGTAHRVEEELKRLEGDPPPVSDTATRIVHLEQRPPMVPGPQSEALAEMLEAAAAELAITTSRTRTGGSSDGNFTAAAGTPTLDGLGPVGGGYHTENEFVLLDSIDQRARLSAQLLRSLAENGLP